MKKIKDILSITILVVLFLITSILGFLFFKTVHKFYNMQERIDQISETAIDLEKLAKVVNLYDNFYIGEIKDKQYYEDIMLKALSLSMEDKYGMYMSAAEASQVEKQLDGEYIGIGIVVSYPEDTNYILIDEVYKGFPGYKAGLKVGDKIYKINGVDSNTEEGRITLQNISRSGAKTVTLAMEDGDKEIKLEKIIMDSVVVEVKDDIGIITINSFNSNTDEEFIKEFNELIEKNTIKYLIFDVRDNSGGDKDAVTKMIDRLAPKGEIYSEVYNNTSSVVESDSECVDIPIIILGNSNSASASELFIMSLQDTNGAIFIGEKTFGKSTILSYFPFNDGSSLVMSTGYYYPPSDRFIEGIGIEPDIVETEDALKRAYEYIKENY